MDKKLLLLAIVIAEAIREAGEIPSGHVYAAIMDKMSLENYQTIIGSLKHAGLVSESNYLLRWTGKLLV